MKDEDPWEFHCAGCDSEFRVITDVLTLIVYCPICREPVVDATSGEA